MKGHKTQVSQAASHLLKIGKQDVEVLVCIAHNLPGQEKDAASCLTFMFVGLLDVNQLDDC
jgi:hypothetical protein